MRRMGKPPIRSSITARHKIRCEAAISGPVLRLRLHEVAERLPVPVAHARLWPDYGFIEA
jgi:hypothetical protein